jgi:cytochrome oxidase Cu insertion factor (SCO1/SenC/PrrC family)
MAKDQRQPMMTFTSFFVAAAFSLLIFTPPLFHAVPAAAADDGGSVWGADYFPDVRLVSHKGKKVRFFTDLIKGKVVLINFIYTNCPDACALETAQLREVQRILGADRVGKDVFFYSITIDPARDTPKVLNQYARKFQIGPGWLFLTGRNEDIIQLRKKLGVYREEEKTLEEHNLSFIMGNQATGQWMKVSPYENPYVMATQVGSWLSNWKQPPLEESDYANAPTRVGDITPGERLFRTRCAPCHTIGAEVLAGTKAGTIGPDLLGVTGKRNRIWLTRWLKEPDKMLAEKDPIAMAQLSEYNGLRMPNLKLNDVDVRNLLEFIEEESQRMGHHHHHDEHLHHHDEHHHQGK